MSTAIYFDCFSGISGDMALGALLDAGLSLEALRAELRKLAVAGWRIDATREMRGYLSGTRALVDAPEQSVHRHLGDVRAIVEASSLSDTVKQRSIHIFTLLAEAEGRVHALAPEQVHFHEVGALDAIVDIVGVVAGLELLGIDDVYASPLPLGSGWVRAAHGLLPVPAPATLYLLAGARAPTLPDTTRAELVTPTGAALLAGLARFDRPALQLERVGYGLGKRDLDHPNALRVWIGSTSADRSSERRTHAQHAPDASEQARAAAPAALEPVLIETNIDDQPAEQLAYVAMQLLELGALDVWQAPITMKKGRVGVLLAALVPPSLEEQAVALIMRETTTLGVRRRSVARHVCERSIATIDTPLGAVRVKYKHWRGAALGAAPEYEDCASLARAHNLPLQDVYRVVLQHTSM